MGTQNQPRRTGLLAGIESTKVARSVHTNLSTEGLHPASDFAVALPNGGRKERPARAALVFTEAGQPLAPGDDLICEIRMLAGSLHWILSLPLQRASSRGNGSA